MDHSEAVKTGAAEKYLLGELAPRERDAFEDHYFSCTECAADLKSAAIFVDNTRELFRTERLTIQPEVPRSEARGWFGWLRPAFAVPVLALLIATVAYQNLVTIPGLRHGSANAPRALATFSLLTAGSRGIEGPGATTITVPHDAPFALYFDIPPRGNFSSYTCEVLTDAGASKFSVDIPAQQAKDSVQLFVPAKTLDSGRYQLSVRGARDGSPAEELARLPFVVQLQP